jgi:hypothetical protein
MILYIALSFGSIFRNKMMKFIGKFAIGAFFLCLLNISTAQPTTPAKKMLLPPWYLLQAQLSATLNADPCVHVDDLIGDGSELEININVCDDEKANALSAFITKTHEFGTILVRINVLAPDLSLVSLKAPKDAKDVVEMLNIALTGNQYFVRAGSLDEISDAAFVEFKPSVVQFYADDISDWYLNMNLVASKAFSEIMDFNLMSQDNVSIYATTSRIKSPINIK